MLLVLGCSKDTDDWVAELRSEEPLQRMLGAAALREVEASDCERVVRELIQMRYDSTDVFAQAEASLRVLAVRYTDVFVELVDDPELRKDRWVVLEPLVDAGEDAIPSLVAALRRGAPKDRRGAALALGRLRQVEPLRAWADEVGGAAIAVAYLGCEPARERGEPVRQELLARVLGQLDAGASESIERLSEMGPSVLAAVIERGADPDTVVAIARPMGDAGVQALVGLRDGEAGDVSSIAATVLDRLTY